MKTTLLALGLTFASLSSFAGTSATLNFKGSVALTLDLSLVADPLAMSLPLDQSQNNTKVATISETSNSKSGYKVTLSSVNSGKLVRTNGSESVRYTLSYGSKGNISLQSPVVISNSAQVVARTQEVKISYEGKPAEQMVAGDYTDSVTFTIAAN